jgi:hypothetical protein
MIMCWKVFLTIFTSLFYLYKFILLVVIDHTIISELITEIIYNSVNNKKIF